MLYDKLAHIIIDQPFLTLKCIHKGLFADPVDHAWNPDGCFIDLIQCFCRKYFLSASRVIHMTCDILFCFRPVQMWKGTVHIYTLANSSISLQLQFIFIFPEFSLTDQHNSHKTHGIKSVVEQEAEFFQSLLIDQMCFIKDVDDFLMLHSPDDLNLLLQLTFGITAIKPGFKSQLIQQSL